MSYFRNYQKENCNEVKAKWRTCPVGELAPVSPILEGIAEKTRAVPGTRTTDRASWFQKRKGTRDHIANLRWMMERSREHQQYIVCFTPPPRISLVSLRRDTTLLPYNQGTTWLIMFFPLICIYNDNLPSYTATGSGFIFFTACLQLSTGG